MGLQPVLKAIDAFMCVSFRYNCSESVWCMVEIEGTRETDRNRWRQREI